MPMAGLSAGLAGSAAAARCGPASGGATVALLLGGALLGLSGVLGAAFAIGARGWSFAGATSRDARRSCATCSDLRLRKSGSSRVPMGSCASC